MESLGLQGLWHCLRSVLCQLDAFPWILAYPFNTTQFTAAVVPSSPSPARGNIHKLTYITYMQNSNLEGFTN